MKKEELLKILPLALNILTKVELSDYSKEFCKKKIIEANEKIRMQLNEIGFSFNDLDKETVEILGFQEYTDTFMPQKDLYLIPLWLYPLLPEGLILTSILGRNVIVGKDNIDNDESGGCLAYGIRINN